MPRFRLNMVLVAALTAVPLVAWAQSEAAPAPAAEATATEEQPADLQILPAEGVDLAEYLWLNRVVVVFADTPADPRFIQQMQQIKARPRDLLERDVVVVTDTDPKARSEVRQQLRPRGFALVMIDKDGDVKLRKPSPWSTREIARSIDKTPLRRDEIRERSGSTLQ